MRISYRHKFHIDYILNGHNPPDGRPFRAWNCPGYYLDYAFPWRSSPQGYNYWRDKIRNINTTWAKEYYALDHRLRTSVGVLAEMRARAFEEHMTEEDWAFLRSLLRDKRKRRDAFFSVGRKKIPLDSFSEV